MVTLDNINTIVKFQDKRLWFTGGKSGLKVIAVHVGSSHVWSACEESSKRGIRNREREEEENKKRNQERILDLETFSESCLISSNTPHRFPRIMFHITYRLISFPESHA